MLYSVVIFQLVVSIIANPLHKYPFVFLLDVGNEELEKTNTEQIRVSVPGGSLAVRYPAVGDGDLITHARVSGIDFGTDLKANILDGGPGYKYIVLVFLGNKGIPYDAVITLQMLPSSEDINSFVQGSSDNSMSQNSEKGDVNNSAEDMDDVSNEVKHSDGNAELAQPSSNVYNYAQVVKDCENDDAFDNTVDIHVDNSRDSVENDVTDNEDDKYQAEKLQAVSKDDVYNNKYNNNLIDSAEMNQDLSSDEDAKMYRQDTIYDAQGHSPLSDDPVELDQMFNDEEIHNDADKFKDSNNNNFDLDYDTAVAY